MRSATLAVISATWSTTWVWVFLVSILPGLVDNGLADPRTTVPWVPTTTTPNPNQAGVVWVLYDSEYNYTWEELPYDYADILRGGSYANPSYINIRGESNLVELRHNAPLRTPKLSSDSILPTAESSPMMSFEKALNQSLKSIEGQPNPELFLSLSSHGGKGVICQQKRKDIPYRKVFGMIAEKAIRFQERNPNLKINILLSACYSGSAQPILEDTLRRAEAKGKKLRVNLLTSSVAENKSIHRKFLELIKSTSKALYDLEKVHGPICSNCTRFERFIKFFQIRNTSGIQFDMYTYPTVWSNHVDFDDWTPRELVGLIVHASGGSDEYLGHLGFENVSNQLSEMGEPAVTELRHYTQVGSTESKDIARSLLIRMGRGSPQIERELGDSIVAQIKNIEKRQLDDPVVQRVEDQVQIVITHGSEEGKDYFSRNLAKILRGKIVGEDSYNIIRLNPALRWLIDLDRFDLIQQNYLQYRRSILTTKGLTQTQKRKKIDYFKKWFGLLVDENISQRKNRPDRPPYRVLEGLLEWTDQIGGDELQNHVLRAIGRYTRPQQHFLTEEDVVQIPREDVVQRRIAEFSQEGIDLKTRLHRYFSTPESFFYEDVLQLFSSLGYDDAETFRALVGRFRIRLKSVAETHSNVPAYQIERALKAHRLGEVEKARVVSDHLANVSLSGDQSTFATLLDNNESLFEVFIKDVQDPEVQANVAKIAAADLESTTPKLRSHAEELLRKTEKIHDSAVIALADQMIENRRSVLDQQNLFFELLPRAPVGDELQLKLLNIPDAALGYNDTPVLQALERTTISSDAVSQRLIQKVGNSPKGREFVKILEKSNLTSESYVLGLVEQLRRSHEPEIQNRYYGLLQDTQRKLGESNPTLSSQIRRVLKTRGSEGSLGWEYAIERTRSQLKRPNRRNPSQPRAIRRIQEGREMIRCFIEMFKQ